MLVRANANAFAKVFPKTMWSFLPTQNSSFACCAIHSREAWCWRHILWMQEWLTVILKDDNYWDQNAFNDLMRRGAEYEERRDDRLFKCATVADSL